MKRIYHNWKGFVLFILVNSVLSVYFTNFGNFGLLRTDIRLEESTLSFSLKNETIILQNNGLSTALFRLTINNWSLSTSADIAEYIRDMSNEYESEPLHRKVWRFVRDARYHFDPLTGSNWLHSPSILLNSVGFGYCDDTATVTYAIWRILGYETRVMALNGHVVPEIYINNHWEMYDPDLQVYYYLSNGSVAGVADLENNASLITAPITPILSSDNPIFDDVYSAGIAIFYTSKTDNTIGEWYMNTLPEDPDVVFQIPRGGNLTFLNNEVFALNTTYGSLAQVNSTIKLTIPKGWTGKIKVPLIIHTIRGNFTLRIGGQAFTCEQELQAFLDQRIDFIPEIYFLDTVENTEVFYILNPLVIGWNESNVINLIGFNLEGISASYLI